MGSSMTPPKKAKESGLSNFIVRPVQVEQVHRMLAIHIIKEEVPFIQVDCPALRKAFAIVGVELKGEKAIRTTYLNRLYEECSRAVMLEMEKMLVSSPRMSDAQLQCTHTHTHAHARTHAHTRKHTDTHTHTHTHDHYVRS